MIVNAIADDFLDESALVNVRNVSPDGITPIKKQYALGQGSSNSFQSQNDMSQADDLSRERRSPENFHPPLRNIDSHEVNFDITENDTRKV